MNEPLLKSDNPMYKAMKMYADQLSDANIAYDLKNHYTQLLSERPDDVLIKHTIASADARLSARNDAAKQTKDFIQQKYPNADFSLAANMERQLFSAKRDSMIGSAVSNLNNITREAVLTDIIKTEYTQSYDFQQNPMTGNELQRIKSIELPRIKKSMQDAITDLRGAGLSKTEVSDRTKAIIQNTYVEQMKNALVAHERAMKLDDPNLTSEAAEKIGYVGESAMNKGLNATTIRIQAVNELEVEKSVHELQLVTQAKELAGKPLNAEFAQELMELKKGLSKQNMSMSDVMSKLPEGDQMSMKQKTQRTTSLDDNTFGM